MSKNAKRYERHDASDAFASTFDERATRKVTARERDMRIRDARSLKLTLADVITRR